MNKFVVQIAKPLLLFFSGYLLLFPVRCWAQWVVLNSGVTTDLNSLFFVDSSTGWAVGNSGVILKTTDGGTTWSLQTSGVTTILRDVYFINSSTGLVVGNDGTILKTVNGGSSWSPVSSGISEILFSLFWVDQNNVWTAGQLGKIRRSIDGGNSWTNGAPNGTPTNVDLRSILFLNSSTGVAAGNNGNIWTTQNAGADWTALFTSGLDVRQLFFMDISTGFTAEAGTLQGQVQKTTNSGVSFTLSLSTTTELNSVHASTTPPLTVWAVGNNGKIFKSTDAGTTFQPQISPTTHNLSKVFSLNQELGFAVGASGTILKFTAELVEPPVPAEAQGELKLIQNLFDPSRGETVTIQYMIKNPGKVTIRIFSLQGVHYNTLVEDTLSAGSYSLQWNGTDFNGLPLASGIYLVHLTGPKFIQVRKVAIVR